MTIENSTSTRNRGKPASSGRPVFPFAQPVLGLLKRIPPRWRIPAALLVVATLAAGVWLKPSSGWWNGEWTIRKKVTINLTTAGIAGPVGTTPVLLRLHEGAFQFNAAREDAGDLRFIAADDKTPLAFHVERFDPIMGEGFVWVKVPELKPGVPTSFWLYYGNGGSKVEKIEDSKGTYDADTVLVYHFGEHGQPPADSSGAGNNAQNAGLTTDGSIIGPGLRLDGKSTITVPASASLEWAAGAPMTWSAWIKFSALQPGAVLFSRRESAGVFLIGVDNGMPFVEVNGQRSPPGAPLAANAWRHLGVVAEPSKITLYLDGEPYSTLNAALPPLKGPLLIGSDANGNGGFVGELDELMVSKAARPAGFLKMAAMGQGGETAVKLLALAQDEQRSGGMDTGYFGVILKSVTLDGWVVIGMLLIMGGLSWYVMFQKVVYLKAACRGNEEFLMEWRHVAANLSVLDHGDPQVVKTMGGRIALDREHAILQAPIYRIYHIGAEEIQVRRSKGSIGRAKSLSAQAIQSIRASLDAGVVREGQKLNNLMVLLTISIAGGPFLGLLGTVVGVMITFAAIAAAGEVNVNSIAPGIAAALVATVAGLGVAIPALFGYNYLISRIKEVTSDMQVFVDEFVTKMAEFYCGTEG